MAESLAESTSMKTTPAASESELGTGLGDDDEYQPDQVPDPKLLLVGTLRSLVKGVTRLPDQFSVYQKVFKQYFKIYFVKWPCFSKASNSS